MVGAFRHGTTHAKRPTMSGWPASMPGAAVAPCPPLPAGTRARANTPPPDLAPARPPPHAVKPVRGGRVVGGTLRVHAPWWRPVPFRAVFQLREGRPQEVLRRPPAWRLRSRARYGCAPMIRVACALLMLVAAVSAAADPPAGLPRCGPFRRRPGW